MAKDDMRKSFEAWKDVIPNKKGEYDNPFVQSTWEGYQQGYSDGQKDEREACAKICDETKESLLSEDKEYEAAACEDYASNIREQ